MSEKGNLIVALNNLGKAFQELDRFWGDLDSTESIKMYPFNKSFDELSLEVSDWVEESVLELEKK